MGLISLDCTKCGASLQVSEGDSTYTCRYCGTVHQREKAVGTTPTPQSLRVLVERALERGEVGKAMQYVEQGLAIDPHDTHLLELEVRIRSQLASIAETSNKATSDALTQIEKVSEAAQYSLQAQFILNKLQANRKVYGTNSSLVVGDQADVDLALEYINRALALCPDTAGYLNLKALLLWEGLGRKEEALELLQKAVQIAPDQITIKSNLRKLTASTSSTCFIATAAFGTPWAPEVQILRDWRDKTLLKTESGKSFVAVYYAISPPVACLIARCPPLRWLVRVLLFPIVRAISATQK